MYASKEDFLKFKEYEALEGVWRFFPTTVTATFERLAQIQLPDEPEGFKLHVEGPFISEKRKGAHNAKYIIPPVNRLFEYVQPATIGLITMALEWEKF